MLENVSELISKNKLHGLHNECIELDKFRFQRVRLSPVFTTIPESVAEALNIIWPLLSNFELTILHEV